MLNKKKKVGDWKVVLAVMLALLVAVTMMTFVGYVLNGEVEESGYVTVASGEIKPPSGNTDAEESYQTLRNEFYKIFNSYVVPTMEAITMFVLIVALVVLGIQRANEQDEGKIKAINKRMIHWAIGAACAFLAPVIVMAVAEISMGIISGWGQ